jgi:hypothetical protein
VGEGGREKKVWEGRKDRSKKERKEQMKRKN